MKTLWKGLFALMFVLAVASQAAAQETNEADTAKTGWLVVGIETSNNSSFFGRNTATRYPYAAPSITYIHNTGIWASATVHQLFDTEDFIDETDLSVGYSFKVRKRLEVDLSYTHFIFGKNTPLVNASTTDALSARTAYDWKYLYSALTGSYIIGSGNDVFTVLENSRYIPLNPLWKGNLPVGLDPKISITAGTQHFSETHTTTTTKKKTTPGSGSTGGSPIGGILDPLKPGGNNGSADGGTTEETTTTTTTTNVSRFRVLNYDFKIPVVVYYGNFEFEPSWRYSIPVNKLEGDESKAQSFYTLSVKYTF